MTQFSNIFSSFSSASTTHRIVTELDRGSNVGDENDVGDKVGRDQSWHKWPSAPRALFCQPTRFSATLHGTVHFGDVWCALLNNLWCGVIWCIIVHFGEVFVWFCMVWCNSMEWYGMVWCKWNGFIQYGAKYGMVWNGTEWSKPSPSPSIPFLLVKQGSPGRFPAEKCLHNFLDFRFFNRGKR